MAFKSTLGALLPNLNYTLSNLFLGDDAFDATQRGGAPGSLYVIEPSPEPQRDGDASDASPSALLFSPHQMQPDQVLRSVSMLGGTCEHIVLVGCEPESFGTEANQEGRIGLSEPVAASVEQAIALIESLIDEAAGRQAERSAIS